MQNRVLEKKELVTQKENFRDLQKVSLKFRVEYCSGNAGKAKERIATRDSNKTQGQEKCLFLPTRLESHTIHRTLSRTHRETFSSSE